MLKRNPLFFIVSSFFILIGSSTPSFAYFSGTQLLSDPTLTHGVNVSPACPEPDKDPRCATGTTYYLENPFYGPAMTYWKLAQWHSRSNLPSDSHCGTYDGYGCLFANVDKRLVFYQDGRIEFAMNGLHEFGGIYRPDAVGPGFILGQPIGELGGDSPALFLNQVTELCWELDIRLIDMDQHKESGYNPALHGAIFPMYLTVQNLTPGDPDERKYIWLGIGLYDDRVDKPTRFLEEDPGTHSLIYAPAYENFASTSVQSGNWVHISGDMMPHLKYAVLQAVSRGYLRSADLSKLKIGGMNIGWEISGFNIGTMQFKNLSLRQFTAKNPKSYEFNQAGEREGWVLQKDLGEWTKGSSGIVWILAPQRGDPQLLSAPLQIDTSVVKKIIIRMANDHQPDDQFQLFWSSDPMGLFSEDASQWVTVPADGGFREYTLDLSTHPKWTGMVRRLRIDPVRTGNGSGFGIDYIRFSN